MATKKGQSIFHLVSFTFLLFNTACDITGEDEPIVPDPPKIEYGISDFQPKKIKPGDTLVINGIFDDKLENIQVSFHRSKSYSKEDLNIELLHYSNDEIKAIVHQYLPNSEEFYITVSSDNTFHRSSQSIYLTPQISPYFNTSPKAARIGEFIELRGWLGENTDPDSVQIKFFGSDDWLDAKGKDTSLTQPYIKSVIVRVPPDAKTGNLEMRSADHLAGPIQGELEVLPRNPLPKKNEWVQVANMGWGKDDYNSSSGSSSFVIDRKVYVVGGSSTTVFAGFQIFDKLFEYDTQFDSWYPKNPFPGEGIVYGIAFSIDGIGYVGTGMGIDNLETSAFYSYNPKSDSWERKADFPGKSRSNAVAFTLNGKAYVGSGKNGEDFFDDFYEYDPKTDSWTTIPPIPGERAEAYAFTGAGQGFVGGGRKNKTKIYTLYSYNPAAKTWTEKKGWINSNGNVAHKYTSANTAVVFEGNAYVGLGYDINHAYSFYSSNTILKYSIEEDRWSNFTKHEGSTRTHSVGFAVDGVLYFGLGIAILINNSFYDFWAYKL